MHAADLRTSLASCGRRAYERRLVSGSGGNLSIRLNEQRILMTPHGVSLGTVTPDDLLELSLTGELISGTGRPSTETQLHLYLYHQYNCAAVVHLHPPYVTTLAALDIPLSVLSFETRTALGKSLVILPQSTPTVTDFAPLGKAFETSNLVVLRNHGTVAIGDSLEAAYCLTDIAEEAAIMSHIALTVPNGLRTREATASAPSPIAGVAPTVEALPVFSRAHLERIRALVNADTEMSRLGKETALTTRYAIKLAETGAVFNMHFSEGAITTITEDDAADFINEGSRAVWVAVFAGRLDPFAATTQKKLKLRKGHLGDLSRWYAPFYRLFELWKQAPVKEDP